MGKKTAMTKIHEYIIIGLLITVCVLLLIMRFPIQIQYTYTDCPEVRCQETVCRIEVVNVTKINTIAYPGIRWINVTGSNSKVSDSKMPIPYWEEIE